MPRYFSPKRALELKAGRGEVARQFRDLQDRIHARTYKTHKGAEFAKHGLNRRLEMLVRSIDVVFELLPPEQDKIPDKKALLDATMAIQAFVMNAFGCLENIAFVLVREKGIRGKGGSELDPKDIGIGKKSVQKSLSKECARRKTKGLVREPCQF
jgi:hypothetical protein